MATAEDFEVLMADPVVNRCFWICLNSDESPLVPSFRFNSGWSR